MSSYRFCRTDDIGLLVDALHRCWAPYFPGQALETAASFKRSIRDLQVWCSSCMVAFSGADPIGVLIGAKRSGATLIHRIAVHPDHRRQGHGRHLLTSLGSKLAILGPPRMVAEVPAAFSAACGLFDASGYVEETRLTDYVLEGTAGRVSEMPPGRFLIPVTVDDLAANGLLEATTRVCWERSIETLNARKEEIAGLAVVSDEQIEACLLYVRSGGDQESTAEVLALRAFVEDDGARVEQLFSQVRAGGLTRWRFPKVHPDEVSNRLLEALGFRPAGEHRLYAATARAA